VDRETVAFVLPTVYSFKVDRSTTLASKVMRKITRNGKPRKIHRIL
jgi:hypothetical protein